MITHHPSTLGVCCQKGCCFFFLCFFWNSHVFLVSAILGVMFFWFAKILKFNSQGISFRSWRKKHIYHCWTCAWSKSCRRWVIDADQCRSARNLSIVSSKCQQHKVWLFHPISGCLCFYIWEAVVDFIVRGTQLFRSLEWLLDVGIISASITELVFLFLGSSVEEVRILKLLRICRVMRLIRFIRKAPSLRELRKLMMMFASVIRTLAWSFLFCFIAMTLWSMISVELIHPIILELAEQGTWNECETCSESFATIMQSNLTFLKTLLAGDSWGQIAVPVMKKQPLTIIIFVGALVSIVYGILNLIVAVIVDAAVEQREKDITTLAADLDYELEEDLKLLGNMFLGVFFVLFIFFWVILQSDFGVYDSHFDLPRFVSRLV